MSKKLLPCPFCGSTKVDTYRFEGENGAFVIQCGQCCAEGPFRATEVEAIEDWNKRADVNRGEDDNETVETVRTIEPICHIRADVSVGMAYVNGEEDEVPHYDESNYISIMPGVIKKCGCWYWETDIDTDKGCIIGWPKGVIARLNYKPCDNFTVWYGGKTYSGYVPDCFSPEEEGYGDYIFMAIDENGFIKGWDKSKFQECVTKEMK